MIRSLTTLSLSALLFTGCLSAREPYEPPQSADYSSESWNTSFDSNPLNPEALAEWWTVLNDPVLDDLIVRAIESNLDLRTAQAKLRKARAQRKQVSSTYMPSIGAKGSVTKSGQNGNESTLYSTGFDAKWELDLFGGTRARNDASEADLQAVEESRRNVLVSVLAETALTYTDLRTLQRRRTLTQNDLDAQLESLTIIEAKEAAGAITLLDVDRARTATAQTKARLPELDRQAEQAKNRLAVLTGLLPGALHEKLDSITPRTSLPPTIAVGVPAEVLRRRPDVRQAERRLAAETYRIGVARSELYPKLTLSGTLGIESLSPSTLLSSDSLFFGLGPGIKWNLFSGGRIRQEIEVQSAEQEIALIDYERTLLNVLEEVENAITAFAQEQLRLRSLEQAEASATRAMQLAETRYQAGATDYLIVLDAQRARLTTEDQLASSNGQLVLNLIRLYKALGGGWEPEISNQK